MDEYKPPNYTQIPNLFMDDHISDMKEAEIKIALVIMRHTFGWHRDSHKMSLSFLQKATGMSRQGVINGVNNGIKRGIIERKKSGSSWAYKLLVNEVDQNTRASQRSRPGGSTKLTSGNRQGVVNEVDTKKERVKERGENRPPPPKKRAVEGSYSGDYSQQKTPIGFDR